MIIEERVFTEDYWREKIASKHEKIQKELHLKLFRERKIRKSETAAKSRKN